MNDQEIILIGRAIDGLGEVGEIMRALVNRGTLPESWAEIVSVMDSIRCELSDTEKGFLVNSQQVGAGQW
jgi:hypothetical protein